MQRQARYIFLVTRRRYSWMHADDSFSVSKTLTQLPRINWAQSNKYGTFTQLSLFPSGSLGHKRGKQPLSSSLALPPLGGFPTQPVCTREKGKAVIICEEV